ncbi:hypothetical protein [Leptospira jelokensis]|uniref:hypothetical protein n=1 Tax=Leptospira jelokensis TaxID=2484931 RepID=UPI0010917A29|nr:hypothetical protein [Leptospira jelokensis]TGL99965.1 hypothetical protein EHQ79_14975 [Leptospira jelokensis]
MKKTNQILIALFLILSFNSGCLIWRTNNIPNPNNINVSNSKKIKLTVSIDGCFPDDLYSCKSSLESFNQLNKEFAKTGSIDIIYGNSNGLSNSDYHLSLYWDDDMNKDKGLLNAVTLFTLGIVPVYYKQDIQLLAIVKKTDGTILQTFEYKESISHLIHILLFFNIPFENLRQLDEIKAGMLKMLLKDLINLNIK